MAGSSQPKTPSLKKTTSTGSTGKNQKSILGFFQRKPAGALQPQVNGVPTTSSSIELPIGSPKKKESVFKASSTARGSQSLTPAPSSDAIGMDEEDEEDIQPVRKRKSAVGLPSPVTPASDVRAETLMSSSPSRKVRKAVNYAESGDNNDDSEEDNFVPETKPKKRLVKRQKTSDASEDNFSENTAQDDFDDLDEDDFIVPDDSDEEEPSRKRKRSQLKNKTKSSPPSERSPACQPPSDIEDLELPTVSTAQQWKYDADNIDPTLTVKARPDPEALYSGSKTPKPKAHTKEPEVRHAWLAKVKDADGHPVGHPDYDPRNIYVPPMAWEKFSAFEHQYWNIKKDLWDTIVFFKKGKFYELYENDATIGHQLFDLKLTDRVNMRMVGVPESSLDHWANQFVAKGFKIARVDQKETALGKEMRERDDKKPVKTSKTDKVIHRELSCVFTSGTLVDGGMLQDDMSTFCVSIKEAVVDGLPAFGFAFVDAATGSFFLTDFVDDVDLTKFETFVAQTRPQELLVERSGLSSKALRILKNNTGPTTQWNNLKPEKEFWTAENTRRSIDASGYFVSDDENAAWPTVLAEAKDKDLVMSAMGGLIWYLRLLKIERELMTLGNFSWYDPIRKQSSLVLDGQTLINLEVFANTFDGSAEGTLFALLNRCVTPFGKRTFKQWVCHPLMDSARINDRLDAVDALNADPTTRDSFISSLTKMPDLERLISRIHAGSCKPQDFVRVLEGYEQIQYTMGLLGAVGTGEGLIGQLVSSMPDMSELISGWKTAFDHKVAKEDGVMVPEPGVEEDFDQSQERIAEIEEELNQLLRKARKDLGCSTIVYRDNGKEIYQLEVPVKVKGIPKSWDQMSATKAVKRYYSPDLRGLVRQLQEAQETHSQIVKEVAGRFLERFDQDYITWLKAVKIVAQLDCLISLAKASSLGEPSCRPTFVEEERSVMELEDLRHPCMLPNVMDFIPNDIKLGGEQANITMLTGANAAGKSTVLRMTCIAVIMAQIGCYVPCSYARLTPVDRIMSRLGANDNIFAAQSTFFVELSETKKILSEATPRSLVILDELGRGTSSYDGVAVAQAVLHHIATHISCLGFFATHYHSLADEFGGHPEVRNKRMRIHVDEEKRQITFLYKLEDGVAQGSFGMHCAAMCGIPDDVIARAEIAAKEWEHTSKLKESLDNAKKGCFVPLGMQSDVAWALKDEDVDFGARSLAVLREAIAQL